MSPPGLREACDAVIIGAGPAGSAAAILLAREGWHVALVERQGFPRRKVCGECIAASNLPLLDELGIGPAVDRLAGAPLRTVNLLHRDSELGAGLPAAGNVRHPWGRALGRETLDTLLLEKARAAGAKVWQPWSVQSVSGSAGGWHCELHAGESSAIVRLHADLVIDAHGSWEGLPADRRQRRLARAASDLFAFKANYTASPLRPGAISVLALDGGYGGMVVADGGVLTVACCIRRDRLSALRSAAPGLRAGVAVEAWLRQQCGGVRAALHGAVRDGAWLAAGPLDPGMRLGPRDALFRIGNAAGEAHPILGEGMSMALQSAHLLCSHLLDRRHGGRVPTASEQAAVQRRYVAGWRHHFAPRLHLAAAFAHAAMRPHGAALLMRLLRRWPGLLTQGARWGGKVQPAPAATPDGGSPLAAAQTRGLSG